MTRLVVLVLATRAGDGQPSACFPAHRDVARVDARGLAGEKALRDYARAGAPVVLAGPSIGKDVRDAATATVPCASRHHRARFLGRYRPA